MIFLRSLAFAIIFYTLTLFWVLVALLAALAGTRPLQAVARSWSRFHRRCAWLLLGQKVRVEGALPDTPCLYVFKHESMFETIDLLCFFRTPAIAAKRELIDIPLWGWVASRYGVIPVERTAGAKAMRSLRAAAKAALAQDRPVCLFAEGTRVPHGEAPPLRAGFAGLYVLLGVPVVPVAVNSGRVAPRGKLRKRPGTITYRVGETIPPGLPRAEAEARCHAAINALNGSSAPVTGNG
ncbi:lysophospholipid acyltransferase family protein [Sphingobium sp. H39-3-25]|uniref:lysophospholipid acyltransferase family protein n=1 Tax=Sphingobium arseniciresistens TaxID=3030834 RepID=UPI0023B9D03E|nr:lysophospholipid acyltransferase family protein [Sphingobium arseniciresistens]